MSVIAPSVTISCTFKIDDVISRARVSRKASAAGYRIERSLVGCVVSSPSFNPSVQRTAGILEHMLHHYDSSGVLEQILGRKGFPSDF